MYERDKDNFSTVRDGLFGLNGHDYRLDELAILYDRDRGAQEVTKRLQRCEHMSHILLSRNVRADALAKNTKTRYCIFSYIDQIRTDGDAGKSVRLFSI